MVDVDERVVQMKFDSSDFETKTKSTFKVLDTLKEKLSFKDVDDSSNLMAIADNVQKVADKAYTIIDRTIDKIKDNIANKLVSYLRVNTIGQIEAGWSKYADMTTSVSTLRAQGYAMDTITEQLERLMYFTDETSFKFTDMVGEIGKFTASGQKLEDATQAMMGIALWASLSGKNANDASRAMYQLSQALGAGQMRLQDYKSIQNLNMDTREFRQNAIDAAVAVGTLKDNLNGTWTSTKNTKVIVDLQNFAESLTKGQWFTTDVMMAVYEQYSEAVDEIHEKYLELGETVPTAQLIKEAKEANDRALAEFEGINLETKDVDKLLKRWKKVVKVTDDVVDDYAEINGLTKEAARKELSTRYAEYLKEYAEIFKGSEADAEEALEKWQAYTSEFGIKAFMSGQEAKTFTEAVESAMDAASTVWLHIYQDIFGDYDEAKELWTSLANNLYDIFVGRLWSIAEIFDYWKAGYKEDMEAELAATIDEYNRINTMLQNNRKKNNKMGFTDAEGNLEDQEEHLKYLENKIETMQTKMAEGLYDGRRVLMQGLEAFGGGFKFISTGFREAWDQMFGENESGKKLFAFSERFREMGFRFYLMMKQFMPDEETGEFANQFFPNIAKAISNLLQPLKAAVEIVKSVVGQFLPSGKTFAETLEMISERIRDITAHLVPTRETITKIARVLRGVVAVIKFIGKAIIGFYKTILKPILDTIFGAAGDVLSVILDFLAELGDLFYAFEEGTSDIEAFEIVWEKLKGIIQAVMGAIRELVKFVLKLLAPVIGFVKGLLESIFNKVKKLFTGGKGNPVENLADSFKNVKKRATDAWKSTESFADIFNRFKEGKGAANFIELIGELLQNLVTKIGTTILAIFNLEEAFDDSKLSTAGKKVKSFLLTSIEIVKWLWTNVLQPMVQTFFQGLGALFRTLSDQVKNGDIKGLLTTIREIIHTFTSMQLFKMLQVITKVFGSGGLLRLMRNASKALKGLWRWEGAMAMDYVAKALLKLAAAFVIVTAAVTALSYLPMENLEKINKMLISFSVLFAIMAGVLIAITAIADRASWGFIGMGFAFGTLAVVMFAFIWAAQKLDEKLSKLCSTVDETTGEVKDPTLIDYIQKLGGTILSFLTIMGVVLSIFAVMRKVTAGSSTITFTLGFIGLITAVSSIVNAIQTLLNIFHDERNSMEEVIIAIGLLMSIFFVLSLSTKVMTKLFHDGGLKFKEGLGEGIAYAILIATMALIIRMVIIPTLDTLVENKDKFPGYVQAMLFIVGCMMGICAAIGLMTIGNGGGLALIAGAVAFKWITNTFHDVLIPAIMELAEIPFTFDLVGGIIALTALMNLTALAIWIISTGISKMLAAMMTINWKAMASLIISSGIVVAGIMLLATTISAFTQEIDMEPMLIVLGDISALFLAIMLMGVIAGRSLNSAKKIRAISVMLIALTAAFAVLGGLIMGLMVIISDMYSSDYGWAIAIISTTMGTLTLLVVAMSVAFAIMVGALKKAFMLVLNKEELALFTGAIVSMLLFTSIILGEIIAGVALIGKAYKDAPLGERMSMLMGSVALIVLPIIVLFEFMLLWMNELSNMLILWAKTPDLIIGITGMTNTIAGILAVLVGLVTTCLLLLSINDAGTNLANAGILFGLIVGSLISIFGTILLFVRLMPNTALTTKKLMLAVATLASIIMIFGLLIPMIIALGAVKTINFDTVGNTLLLFLGVLTSVFVAVGLFLYATQTVMLTRNKVYAIGAVLLGIAAILLTMGLTVIPALKNLKDTDPDAILAAFAGLTILIIGSTGLIAALEALKTFNWRNSLTGVLTFFGVLGTIALFGPAIISIFKEFKDISIWDVIVGLLAILGPFAGLLILIAKINFASKEFFISGAAIAGVITMIAASIWLLSYAINDLMKTFGLNFRKEAEDAADAMTDTLDNRMKENENMNSPSRKYAMYGKYIVQGLALGINKNKKLAKAAADALGLATNEGFCDELEIQSPSKVFYENGRFVIRGLVDGMNSYKSKAYDTGDALGDGISDSLSEGLGKAADDFLGIWNNKEMDAQIEKAGSTFSDTFLKGVFGDETAYEYTEDEIKRMEYLQNEIKSMQDKAKSGGLTSQEGQTLAQYQEELKQLEAKGKTTSSDFANQIKTTFNKAFGGEGGIGEMIGGGLFAIFGDLKDGVVNLFGGEETKEEINKALNGEDGVVTNTINTAGEKIKTGLENIFTDLTNDISVEGAAAGLGRKLGQSISDSIGTKITEWFKLDYLWTFLSGDEIPTYNKATFLNWRMTKGRDNGLYNDTKYTDMMNLVLAQNDKFEFEEEWFDNAAEYYKSLSDFQEYITGAYIDGTGAIQYNVDYSSYLRDEAQNLTGVEKDFYVKLADAVDEFLEAGHTISEIDLSPEEVSKWYESYVEAVESGRLIPEFNLANMMEQYSIMEKNGLLDGLEGFMNLWTNPIAGSAFRTMVEDELWSPKAEFEMIQDNGLHNTMRALLEREFNMFNLSDSEIDRIVKDLDSRGILTDIIENGLIDVVPDLTGEGNEYTLPDRLLKQNIPWYMWPARKKAEYQSDTILDIQKYLEEDFNFLRYMNNDAYGRYTALGSRQAAYIQNMNDPQTQALLKDLNKNIKYYNSKNKKYLNTPGTSLYDNGQELVGMNNHMNDLIEGTKYENVLSKLGIQISEEQLDEFKRTANNMGILDETTGEIVERSKDNGNRIDTFNSMVYSKLDELIAAVKEKVIENTETKPTDVYSLAKAGLSKKNLEELYAKAAHDPEAAKYLASLIGAKSVKELFGEIENRFYELDYKFKRGTATAAEKAEREFYTQNYGMYPGKAHDYYANEVKRLEKENAEYQSIIDKNQKIKDKNKEDSDAYKKAEAEITRAKNAMATNNSYINSYKEAYKIGEDYVKGYGNGVRDGKTEVDESLNYSIVQTSTVDTPIKLGEASPSVIAYKFGQYFVKGFDNGIIDGMTDSENTIEDWTNLINSDTELGLNAMSDMLEEDINPRITPILDSSSIDTGMTDINRAIDLNSPKVEATFNSFERETPNYDSKFSDLELAIGNTNMILGELMDLLETGDVTKVDVEVHPSPDNIYDSVVNTNRQRFKRTGRNGFMI